MSIQKIRRFSIPILIPVVILLAFALYIQTSEIRQMRGDMDSFEQSASSLRLVSVGVWVDDEPLVSLQVPQIAGSGLSISDMTPASWWKMYPDTVRTITRGAYGAGWPFPTDDAILGCHGGEVLAVVNGGDFMVDSTSPSLHFFLSDISDISVFAPSSSELADARDRMIKEAESLCHGNVVR